MQKIVSDATTNPAFEAEARRLGRIMLHRQRLFAAPWLAGAVLMIALVGCIFFVPVKERWLYLCLLTVLLLALSIVGVPIQYKHWKRRYGHLPTVVCPICGGEARVQHANSPYTYLHLVCTQCGQRANTKFFVNPFFSLYQ